MHAAGDTPAARALQLAHSAAGCAGPGHMVLPGPGRSGHAVAFLIPAGVVEWHIAHPALRRCYVSCESWPVACCMNTSLHVMTFRKGITEASALLHTTN